MTKQANQNIGGGHIINDSKYLIASKTTAIRLPHPLSHVDLYPMLQHCNSLCFISSVLLAASDEKLKRKMENITT